MDTVVRNVCWLSPPEPPIFDNTPNDAKKRMLNFRDSCSAYQNYTKHCLDKGNGTFTASPEPITSDSGSNAVIPVIITVTVILLAAIVVAVWHIKKKKGSGYRLFIQVQKFFYKDPSIRRNRESSSSNGSKKSRNNSAASESGVPNNVVTSSQVSMNEKDFKHASTAQLIDETSIKSEYENPTIGPVMEEYESFTVEIEMEQKEISDTQTDSDVHKSNSISPNHKALNSSDYSDKEENDPPYDTPPKRSFQRDHSEDGGDLHPSREGMEGGDVETSETEKAMEDLKYLGYETHVHSPSPSPN